jgi:hypothetical protein
MENQMSKRNDPNAALGNPPKASKVVDAKEDVGACIEQAKIQNGGNIIPLTLEQEAATAKARESNSTGALNSDPGTHK